MAAEKDPKGASDWEALRYFMHAAQAKSLSGAARRLGVEHTTIGRRLSALERSLGVALVTRGPAGLDLTRLGRRALRLVVEMDRAARAVEELSSAAPISVRLFVPTGFSALLSSHLETLRRQQPRLLLDIVSSARRIELGKRRPELAIRVGPIDDPTLVARKLGDVGSGLYAARSYIARAKQRIDPEDLSGQAVIGFHQSLAELPAAEWLARRSRNATVVMRCRDASDLLSAARGGAGIAVLPCFLADAEPSLVRLTEHPVASRRVSLVYRKAGVVPAGLRAAINFIVEALRVHAAELRG